MKKIALVFLGPLCLFTACKESPLDPTGPDASVLQDGGGDGAYPPDGGADVDAEVDASVAVDAAPPPLDDCFARVSAKGAVPPDRPEGSQPINACNTLSPRCQWLEHCGPVNSNNLRNGICVTQKTFNLEACRCGPGERCIGMSSRDERTVPDSGVCRVVYVCASKTCFPDAGWPFDCTTTPAPY